MARSLLLISSVAVVLAVLAAHHATAFVIRPTFLTVVGRAEKGAHFWKPHAAVAFNSIAGALKVLTSPHPCEGRGCDFRVAYTADGGETFDIDDELHPDFCGPLGIVRDGKLFCPSDSVSTKNQATTVEEPYAVEEYEFSIAAGGFSSKRSFNGRKTGRTITFSQTEFTSPIQLLRFGDRTAHFPEKAAYLRNVEATHKNGSVSHVVYKSVDNGRSWVFVSYAPFPFGDVASLQRIGDTKVMLISGKLGALNQSTSVYLGSRWEKNERASFSLHPEMVVSPYSVAVYAGVRGRPGLKLDAVSGKKGSDRSIDLADFHNRIAAKLKIDGIANFSQQFSQALSFSCVDPTSNLPLPKSSDWDVLGCGSSSFVTTMSLTNGSFFAFYDQLGSGFNAARDDDDHTVYAMRIGVNDTKEKEEYEEKVREAERRKEQERLYEEQREKERKERIEQKKRQRREKQRKNRERRAAYELRDVPYQEEAALYSTKDGEKIVVRDVDNEWVEFEKAL